MSKSIQDRMLEKRAQKEFRKTEGRRDELLAAGIPEDQIDEVLEKEAYDRAPIDQKIVRLERIISGLSNAIAGDMRSLHHNDAAIADAIDLNFKSISLMLESLGISKEKQLEFIVRARSEIDAERAAADKESADAREKEIIEAEAAEMRNRRPSLTGEESPVGADAPEGATTFGG